MCLTVYDQQNSKHKYRQFHSADDAATVLTVSSIVNAVVVPLIQIGN